MMHERGAQVAEGGVIWGVGSGKWAIMIDKGELNGVNCQVIMGHL